MYPVITGRRVTEWTDNVSECTYSIYVKVFIEGLSGCVQQEKKTRRRTWRDCIISYQSINQRTFI